MKKNIKNHNSNRQNSATPDGEAEQKKSSTKAYSSTKEKRLTDKEDSPTQSKRPEPQQVE